MTLLWLRFAVLLYGVAALAVLPVALYDRPRWRLVAVPATIAAALFHFVSGNLNHVIVLQRQLNRFLDRDVPRHRSRSRRPCRRRLLQRRFRWRCVRWMPR